MSSSSIQILHRDRIPATGVLVIPSRLNFEQLLQLEKLFNGRNITWLVEETSQHDPALLAYLEKSGSGAMFTATDTAPAAAGEQLKPYLTGDGVLIYVPGRSAARSATTCRIPASHLQAMCSFGLPLLAVAIDCPRESALSIERRQSLPHAVFSFAKPIPADRAGVAAWQQALLEASEESYRTRSLFDGSLGMALLAGLRKHGSKKRILDGADDTELPYGSILAAALAFSKHIRAETDQPRVAIVLPPGKGGLIANLAVIFAGKTPVNLNFTAGPEAIRSCIRQAGVDRFITADPSSAKSPPFHGRLTGISSSSSASCPRLKRKSSPGAFFQNCCPPRCSALC
jgi:acyl-[acyl-carrier-protein]-phospholipid O-acyltransferase/long-chain-fatty-acid--[acyl-carrier-protein] ligase